MFINKIMKTTYIIEFLVIHTDNINKIDKRKCKMKNCDNILHAKVKLEKVLERDIKTFKQLIVLTCREEDTLSKLFGDMNINGSLSDIFGNGFKK